MYRTHFLDSKCHLGLYKKKVITVAMVLATSACTSVNFDESIAKVNQQANGFTQGQLGLIKTQEQRELMDKLAKELLNQPITQGGAVRLALVNSPALQAMLAQSWADTALAAQTGQIANPSLSLERMRIADELEIGRFLAVGLLDIITLPQRKQIAKQQIIHQQLLLTSNVIDQITQVRLAWVKAVAAQQSWVYAKQVYEAAQLSSDLARRMQAVGNFTKLQRARQQAFYADAVNQLATAQHTSLATKEELIRLLGLTQEQAKNLQLPNQLPVLPKLPRSPQEVSLLASQNRLDVQLAQAQLAAQAKAQGLNKVTSWTDIELGARRDSVFDNAEGKSDSKKGYELSFQLPLFDWGVNQRDAMNAQTLAAANRLEATVRSASSSLRENYSAYRTAYDVSQHYRDEVVPLRKLISEENLLRYNGMLIGVFDLLADSRDQIGSVTAAISAQQQFWLADAALQASIIGKPTTAFVGTTSVGSQADVKH
jgi:hypothetical protein